MYLRFNWRAQAAEAIQFIHRKGVVHSDLRPENFLFHTVAGKELDLLLCDFGGSTNGEIDGRHLPDAGFFNPCHLPESTESTDIFSLGSIYYTIMTGHWLYRTPGPFKSLEEMETYQEQVDDLFASKRYPPVDGLEVKAAQVTDELSLSNPTSPSHSRVNWGCLKAEIDVVDPTSKGR